MKAIRFHPEAEAELEAASDYYEGKRAGLGAELEEEVEEAVNRIARMPQSSAGSRSIGAIVPPD